MDVFLLVKIAFSTLLAVILAIGGFFTGGSSTVSATAAPSAPAAFPQAAQSSASTTATTTPLAAPAKAKAITAPPPSQTPKPAPAPAIPQEELNTIARASLVNILCTTKSGGTFNPISGSGVIIDSRGIILTNAHVAQYFLLHDYPTPGNVECIVRTGSPATPRYTAELLYLPPTWVSANAAKIKDSAPTGSGENDYAFLRITGAIGTQTMPAGFPALPMDGYPPSNGTPVLLAAYPAGFLGGIAIATSLYISSAPATVGQLYSFSDAQEVDLFSLGGSIVAQAGSSGGVVLSQAGKLLGIIVTEVPADTTAARDLRALSLGHIDRSLAAQGQGGIAPLLTGDVAAKAASFNAAVASVETKTLEDVLDH